MKIWTANFYKVRFFDSSIIGLSTAMWDPDWFHDYKTQRYGFIDKNGFVCGMRDEQLMLPRDVWQKLVDEKKDCVGQLYCDKKPDCFFMQEYMNHLKRFGYEAIMKQLQMIYDEYEKSAFNTTGKPTEIVLLVHEKPTCPCGERIVLQQFFKENGVEVKEWEKDK